MKITELLNPNSIAIVGASSNRSSPGNIILRNLKKYYNIYPVNPKRDYIEGLKCYKRLEDIEDDIDWAILSLPAEKCLDAVKSCVERGVKLILIIASGFSEAGNGKLEKELKKIVEGKSRIVGPNTLGLLLPSKKLNTIFIPDIEYNGGNVAFLAQSGSLGVILVESLKKENMGISFFLGLGNRIDINENEILDFLEKDDNTKIISLYLESFFNAREFFEKSKRISVKKPIILLKAGKNNKSSRAIKSHTGRISNVSPNLLRGVIRQNGVIEANDLEDIIDFSKALLKYKKAGSRVAIITSAGGLGVISTDYISEFGELELAEFDEETVKKLKEILPPFVSCNNPVDLTSNVDNEMYVRAIEVVNECENVDMVLALIQFHPSNVDGKLVDILAERMKKIRKPVFFSVSGLDGDKVEKMKENLLVYPNIRRAMNAMNCLAYRTKWLERKEYSIIKKIKSKKEDGIFHMISETGMKIPKYFIVENENEVEGLRINFPVACKVYSDKIYHKTDAGGVVLNIKDRKELKRVIVTLKKKFNEKLIIQEMVSGIEFILGITHHEELGEIIMFGLGGVLTELNKKHSFRMLPITKEDAKEMVNELDISPLFKGYRGIRVSREDMINIILKSAEIAYNENILFEINPLIANENGIYAVDIKLNGTNTKM
ncbi:MAG: acetate--CoA ligase family protein [Thermoplasmata archaeon]|nr:acetate--CoA ligase family protein [Thermoplasmata archaeon]